MTLLLFLLLGSIPVSLTLELRHEGFTGRSMPVQGFKADGRHKEISKLLKKLCRCRVTDKRGSDYRMIFTVNHRPYGELSELTWEVRDRNSNELARGWAFTAHRAASDAWGAVSRRLP